MVARTAGRKGRPWRRVQARVYAEETHCCLCGRYVDQTLPDYRSRDARSVHHLIPPDIAPHLAHARENLRLAHIGCNSTAGRGVFSGRAQREPSQASKGSVVRRRWTAGPRVRAVQAPRAVTLSDRDW